MANRLRSLLQRYPRAVVHSHGYKPDILLSLLVCRIVLFVLRPVIPGIAHR